MYETLLAKVASRCEYEYGFNKAIGYMYMSVKDNLRWSNLSVKHYTSILMEVGRFMAMDEKDFDHISLEYKKMNQDEIASVLISAYGDGR